MTLVALGFEVGAEVFQQVVVAVLLLYDAVSKWMLAAVDHMLSPKCQSLPTTLLYVGDVTQDVRQL